MRSIKRNIARTMMKAAGITKINKKQYTDVGKSGKVRKTSYFSRNWRAYLDPTSDLHKQAVKAQDKRQKVS